MYLDDSTSPDFWFEIRLIDGADNLIAYGRFTNTQVQKNTMPVVDAPVQPDYFQIQVRKGSAGVSLTVAGVLLQVLPGRRVILPI